MEALASEFGFLPVHNPHPDWGISHTIRLGLEALGECGAALFQVSDQPMLRRETVKAEVEFFRRHPDKLVGLGHDGVRGNPCIFPAAWFPELLALKEDEAELRRQGFHLRVLGHYGYSGKFLRRDRHLRFCS